MPIATISQTTLSTLPLTVNSFLTALNTAFTSATNTTAAAPYTVTTVMEDNMIASSYYVWRVTTDSTKAKGVAFLRINAALSGSTLTITQSLSDTWNSTTHAVTGAAAGSASAFTSALNINNPVTFTAIRHPEMQVVLIDQGTSPLNIVGWVRPAFKISEWDEATCPFLFIPATEAMMTFWGVSSTLFPFTTASAAWALVPHTQYRNVNPVSGQPALKPGPHELLSSSNQGGCGSFSSDFAMGACAGISRILNTLTSAGKTYTILVSNTTNASFLVWTS